MNRKAFLRNTGLSAISLAMGASLNATPAVKNKLPKWKGFNLLDYFSPTRAGNSRNKTTADHLKWMRDWGFDFVRLPMAYPAYLDRNSTQDITPEEVYRISNKEADIISQLAEQANDYGLHVSLNLHRAPGYCINSGFHEPYNLWRDAAAQEAFYYHWNFWARRFRHKSAQLISFDLVNEPAMREDMNDQHSKSGPVPGEVYRKVAKAAAEAIRKENPGHLVIADGNNVGNTPIFEIADLDIGQSCRGYFPGAISHYKAPWANKDVNNLPEPKWPGRVGNSDFSKEMLVNYYKPWMELISKGVGVHCGECGCWNKTPHTVFLDWFTDLLDVLRTGDIGIALWNFVGDFGILNSGRSDVAYEEWYGYKLDKKLLELVQRH